MDYESYKEEIDKKVEKELKKILAKEELTIEEIRFLDGILSSIRMKKLSSLI